MDNSSAPVMSETEDDDSQISKKDVRVFSHHLSINTRQLESTVAQFSKFTDSAPEKNLICVVCNS